MSQSLPLWGSIAAIAVGTFLLRLSFVQWWAHREVHPMVDRLLRLMPAAVLCALVVPGVVFHAPVSADAANAAGAASETAGLLANPRLLAGIAAALVAARTRNVLGTIAVGMVTLWLIQWWQSLP